VLFDELLVLLISQLVEDRSDIRLGDSSSRKEPARGTGPCRNNHPARLKFSQISIVDNKAIDTSFSSVLLRHKDLIQDQLVCLLTGDGALHLEVDPLPVEILEIFLL